MRICLCILSLCLVACGGESSSATHDQHEHDHGSGHVHHAPHGGTLIEIGAHQANIEVLFDAKTGQVDVYILGPHAERSLRLADKMIPIQFTLGEQVIEANLMPQASALSGETVGDTSHFQLIDERLIDQKSVQLVVPSLSLFGQAFTNISGRM